MKFAIRIQKEGEQQHTIPLVGTIRAGRVPLHNDEENLLVDSHQTVSRRHALFINKEDSVFLFDCGSVNQTFLNEKAVEPNQEIKLRAGDKIRLADSTSVITIEKTTGETKKEGEERSDHSRSRSREKEREKKKATVSASTKKMLKGIDKYKSRQDKIKFLKLMGLKNAEEELDLIEAEKTTGKVNFDRANQQIERQFQRGRMSGAMKKGLGV